MAMSLALQNMRIFFFRVFQAERQARDWRSFPRDAYLALHAPASCLVFAPVLQDNLATYLVVKKLKVTNQLNRRSFSHKYFDNNI